VPLVRALGWFSLALGAFELVAPRAANRMAGLSKDHVTLTRLFGARELASGIGILTTPKPGPWVKARVAGDAMDLATLAMALLSGRNHRGRTLFSLAAVAAVTALDLLASRELDRSAGRASVLRGLQYGVPATASLIVNRSPQECYAFWRQLENLPRFMRHLESVTVGGAGESHWVAMGPAGIHVEWDAQVTEDRPGALLAWRSLPDSQIPNSGTVRFEEPQAGRGTLIKVILQYDPPAGRLGATVAKLFGEEPSQQIREDLRRFKQLIETGEIPTTRGQPSGRRSRVARMFGKGETP
jgi:uncharacterized membrane protein